MPLVYTVPMRENMTQSRATSDAVKMVNINSWRPLTNKVCINIQGVSTSDTVRIDGNVYGGGNSATVQKLLAYGASEDTDKSVGDISVNIGNHVRIGGVFMGCNGEELFVTSEDNDFMNMFQKLNGDINDYTQELDFAEPIDWINDSENANISTVYLPTEKSKRPIVYPYLLDLYFQPVETDIQGSLKWNGSETGEGLTDCVIGTFCCGGNRGNMNVLPKTSGKIGNVLEYTFPEGLTITDKIVGGCNNTNYDYKGKAKHRGGYLLGDADSEYPFIKLNIRNKFMPKEKNGAYVGGNVYGGCFKSGTIIGDVLINLQSDMLAGKDKDKLEKSNELLVKAAEYSALNVYGAGYGMESYIYGIANVTIGESVKCSEPKMDGNKFLPCGVVDPDSNPEGLGVSANFIYGGGQQGNVVGYSTIKMLNGHIFRAVTGGSYSGYVYGSTQVIVGYPTYYSTNPQNHVRGRYELKRADRKNLGVENDNGKEKTPAIKQHIYLLNDEWISQGVYEDIVAIDNGNGMRDTITDANRDHYFKKIVSAAPSVGWENVNITIDEAVYGGGYSVAQGSVFANNTTVLKLTDKYNLDYAIIANGNGDDLNLLPGGSTAGFCGNTLVLVGDNKDSEHVTISHQDIRPVQLPDGTDLYGYYYKHYASDDDAANGIYTYRYISLQDKYFFKSGATPPSGLEGIRENEFYEYDSEGGIFGDGHLSYAQGFRSADLTGYGFAGHTIDNPKILNTFQRLDIIRLEDNCFSLLGARDYTVNDVNKTPYSIARVGEIKMVANDIRFDSNGNLEAKPDNNTDFKYSTKARNYIGFSNNILYVSAITSNVDFNSGMWRNRNGQLAAASTDNTAFAGMSYQGVKQHYIDDYNANKDKEDAEDPFGEFQKRNDGTAMNMIGIASGYAMKIQLCHETYDSDRKKVVENKLYGPIYGVVEMNLINVREDEGGGYVYADNNHKRHDGDSHEEDFLETTGNFVFPYHKGRYIVDDCFPTGYHAITAPGSDKTVDDVKVHYWYVTGFHYYYNVNISGYTFKSSKENPLEFDSDNKDGLTVLAGLKSTQPISIFNWKMRSGHPDDKSQYSSDLEYRNYLTGTETNETDKTYYSDAVAGGYKLYVGGAESNNFSGATSIDDPDKASKGFAALLSMREKGDDEATLFNNSLPAGLKEDAKISFRLVDMVDNTNYIEPDYFDKHLGRKSMATLVLKAPAYEEYVSETDNKPIYTNTGKFYKKTETGYELVESGNLDADKFVVHNYHRMDPHKDGINLHLAEAITRVNEESLDTTESDPLPEPRIYISDKSDLSAFVAFVDSIGTDSNAPRYGAKAQFFLQNDIALEATDKGGYYISDFAGILHGDGHVISGIPSGKSLFNNIESSGNIYNLGLASGKISNLTADGKIGNYHCCFEYAPASGKSGSTPVVYRWDGSPYKGYTTEDFRLGRVAYDLNEYYLRARHRDAATTSSTEADADNEILKYVSAYYANGDYQYACRTDAITGKNTGITYLRIGKGGDTPNYEQVETRHDKTHPLDAPRVKYNADGSIPTPVVYTPLFNANNSGTEPMNDFLFWGQSLQHNPDNYPCDIASHQNSYMSNRVYRTAAYYGDTSLDAFHYNAYNNGSITMSTYVHDSATTAVDFTCLHDLPAATETVGGIFYPPMDDNASRFNDFVVREDAGITQNLLVYTADNDEATGNEAYDVVEKALNYNETTREALINGHHITKGIDGYSTSLLHLVERTPDNENGDGETCNNNNLCVPIAFNVNDRAWYVRRPLHYAEDSKGAWEGICLPFTVDKAAASLNGEITHFYGSPSDTETDNPSQNIHSLHHEYWLRGLTSIATEGNVPSAVFQRPGAALFSPTDASGNALTNGVSYTFANTFFVDNYADKLYNQYANPYYATAHNYPDYLRLAGEVPYIVRFPGARYYEFDLSSAFYNDTFGTWEDAQTVTFNAYGDNHTGDTSYGAITIPVTKGMATTVGGKYSHLGTFSAINVSNGNVYGMNDSGTAFDDASSLSTVMPFRTYMSPTATRSNARYDYTSVINIAEQNADNIMPDMEENEDDAQTEDHITVRAIGNQRVRIESTMATRLNVVTVAGQLYRILDVQPGIATYSDFQPGLYIFGTTKVIVR